MFLKYGYFCIFLVLLLCAIPAGVFADTGTISGTVQDMQTGKPLADVNVTLRDTEIGAATSQDGRFVIEGVPVGKYTVVVARIGYQQVTRDITVERNASVTLSFELTVKPVEVGAVVVEREMLIGDPDRIFSIPGSAHYISPKELAKHEYNDIHRALREIPGVNIQDEEGYGLRPNIGFRGTGVERSQKITVMEDGVLIAPAPYAAPAAYYFPTVGRMHSIEIRKGSSQIKYGPYTTGGALNLISTPIPGDFRGNIELLGGQDNARRIHATAGNSFKNFGFVAETFQDKVDGFKELDGGGDTGYDVKDYLVKFRLNTNVDASVYQQLEFKLGQTDHTSDETYLGLTDADFDLNPFRRYAASQRDVMNTEHDQWQVRHFIRPSSTLDLTTTVYRTEFHRNWYKLDGVKASVEGSKQRIGGILEDPDTFAAEYNILTGQSSPNEDALFVRANNRNYYAAGVQSMLGLQFTAFGNSHEAEFGIRYHEDELDRFQWDDTYRMDGGVMKLTNAGTPGTESNRISQAKVWAGFAQFSLKFGALNLVPGLRYENIELSRDDFGKTDPQRTGANLSSRENKVDVVIPGVGLDYKFSNFFSSFFGVHKGFAPPGSREGTRPEESINYELGFRYRNEGLGTQTVFFFNDYSNLLGSDLLAGGGEGTGDLFNGGKAEVKGLELSLSYDLGRQLVSERYALPLRLAYTFTDGTFQNSFDSEFGPWGTVETGDELPYLPKHQLFASLGFETGKFGLHTGARYVSKMRTVAGQGDIIDRLSTDARFVIDASAEYAIAGANRLFVSVRNLTDDVYIVARRPAGVRPGLPRTFVAGIKSHF